MNELRARLNLELDVVQLIKSSRYSHVLSKIKLRKTQRALINSFKNYVINAKKPFRAAWLKANELEHTDLDFSCFDPEKNRIDQMILFQTTGQRVPGKDYPFTQSENCDAISDD